MTGPRIDSAEGPPAPRRGRPHTYSPGQRRELAELIRRHGARGARAASLLPVSLKTLLTIAREFGIPLKKGRRPNRSQHFRKADDAGRRPAD